MQEIIILHPILLDSMNVIFQRIKCLSDFFDEVDATQQFSEKENGYCQLYYKLKTGFYLRHCIFVSPRGYRCRATIHRGPLKDTDYTRACIKHFNEQLDDGRFELNIGKSSSPAR